MFDRQLSLCFMPNRVHSVPIVLCVVVIYSNSSLCGSSPLKDPVGMSMFVLTGMDCTLSTRLRRQETDGRDSN